MPSSKTRNPSIQRTVPEVPGLALTPVREPSYTFMRTLFTLTLAVLGLLADAAYSATGGWQDYAIAEHGFSVALPAKPQVRTIPVPPSDGALLVYEAFDPTHKLSKFSVFVGQQKQRGIYEKASMDAFLSAHVNTMVLAAEQGRLTTSQRTTFRGLPALEYQFAHQIEGQPYVGRGVLFMIDGSHMRVSMWYPAGSTDASLEYDRFVASFKLMPVAFRPATTPFRDERGLSFSPPSGWVQEPVKGNTQAAKYSNLTRSMQVLVAGNPAYTCAMLQGEAQSSGRLKEAAAIELESRQFTKLLTFEDVQKYNVRLTTVHYCLNSRLGAVVLGGTEEEAMFWRWAEVYEGAARSVRVR